MAQAQDKHTNLYLGFMFRYFSSCQDAQIILGVCEEISVNNQIFYDNELAEGLF